MTITPHRRKPTTPKGTTQPEGITHLCSPPWSGWYDTYVAGALVYQGCPACQRRAEAFATARHCDQLAADLVVGKEALATLYAEVDAADAELRERLDQQATQGARATQTARTSARLVHDLAKTAADTSAVGGC